MAGPGAFQGAEGNIDQVGASSSTLICHGLLSAFKSSVPPDHVVFFTLPVGAMDHQCKVHWVSWQVWVQRSILGAWVSGIMHILTKLS
jgi:hypothetical protein